MVICKSYETQTPRNKMQCFLKLEQTGHIITSRL